MDFYPKRRADAQRWWQNLHNGIEEKGPQMNLSAEDIAAAKASAAAVLESIATVGRALSALKAARAREKAVLEQEQAFIRNSVRYWKTRPGYAASGAEGKLQLSARPATFDAVQFKPTLRARVVGGRVRISYTKGRCDGVIVYSRLAGSSKWTELGRDKKSPYIDETPLAQPGVPELREYMVMGFKDESIVGQPSDVFSLLYGG